MADIIERRRIRSDDPVVALHYQLSAVRRDAALDALVLVDDRGCLVAGSGSWPVCEELAAYTPLIAQHDEAQNDTVATRAGQLARETRVRTLSIDGSMVFLCIRGGSEPTVAAAMARAASGCRRILGA